MDIFRREYAYRHISVNEIRLLRLLPGLENAELEGTLDVVNLTDIQSQSYEALSYYWGDKPKDENQHYIKILQGAQSYCFFIRQNLRLALCRLRSRQGDKYLWVDALCIDQLSNEEKNVHLPRIFDIYHKASSVCIWLGKEEDGSAEAMAFVSLLLKLDSLDDYIQSNDTVEQWAGFATLLRRPWFNRRWIVQELAVAREARVLCGKAEVPWRDFADAVSFFSSKHVDLRQMFKASAKYGYNPDYLGYVKQLGAYQLVHVASNFFRKSDDGDILEHLQPLDKIVSVLAAFDASNERDIIYAVVSLSNDVKAGLMRPPEYVYNQEAAEALIQEAAEAAEGAMEDSVRSQWPLVSRRIYTSDCLSRTHLRTVSQTSFEGKGIPMWKKHNTLNKALNRLRRPLTRSIPIHYELPVFDVYKNFLELAISGSQSLDIICRPWAGDDPSLDLPSWIPRKQGAIFALRQNRAYSRVRADLLVGSPISGGKTYSASGESYESVAVWRYENDKILTRSLVVKGVVLDTIETVLLPSMAGTIPFEWTKLPDHTDTLWRTLVANRGPEGQKPPPAYYKRACQYAFDRRVNPKYLDPKEMLTDGCPSIVREFLERIEAVTWMRRMIRTRREGFIGLTPFETKEGDVVCILDGCSVPVVLRKHQVPKLSRVKIDVESPDYAFQESALGEPGLITDGQLTADMPEVENGVLKRCVEDQPSHRRSSSGMKSSSGPPIAAPLETEKRCGIVSMTAHEQQRTTSKSEGKAKENDDISRPATVPGQSKEEVTEVNVVEREIYVHDVQPMILSDQVDSWRADKPDVYYEFIGECYIHGMMDGEATKLTKFSQKKNLMWLR